MDPTKAHPSTSPNETSASLPSDSGQMIDGVLGARVISDEIRVQHARIFAVLVALARAALAVDPDDVSEPARRQIKEKLSQLIDHLQQHFAYEAKHGLTQRLSTCLPEAADEISQLDEEHRLIIRMVKQAQEHATDPTDTAVHRLVDDIAALLELMYAHEAAEHNLMNAALAVGSGDGA